MPDWDAIKEAYGKAKEVSWQNKMLKAELWRQGVQSCEVCGWRMPSFLQLDMPWSGLHLHHIVPRCCNGVHDLKNVVILCPDHHTIARHLGVSMEKREWIYHGPRTKAELIKLLQRIDKDPDSVRREILKRATCALKGLK